MKDATVSARVEYDIKNEAEDILQRLGVPVSVVINPLYRQIIFQGGIPFSLALPRPPRALDGMVPEKVDAMLSSSYAQSMSGQGRPFEEAFDDWDALYCVNEFSVTPANAHDRTVTAEVYGLPNADTAIIELWVDGESVPRASTEATPGETMDVGVMLETTFVPDHFETWAYHKETKSVPVSGRPVSATFTAPFLKTEGVVDEPAGKEGQPLSPINTQKGGITALDVIWPSGVPIVGGGELKFWSPLLPVNVFVNPFGLVQLTLSVPLWGYRNDQGDESPHGWGRYPRPTVAKQWEKKVKTMKQMADKSFDDLLRDLVPITDEMLSATAEASISA